MELMKLSCRCSFSAVSIRVMIRDNILVGSKYAKKKEQVSSYQSSKVHFITNCFSTCYE